MLSHFAVLVLAAMDKNIRRIWSKVKLNQETSILSIKDFNSYRNIFFNLSKLLPDIRVSCKCNEKIKFREEIQEILEIIDAGNEIQIESGELDALQVTWHRHIIYQRQLVDQSDPLCKYTKFRPEKSGNNQIHDNNPFNQEEGRDVADIDRNSDPESDDEYQEEGRDVADIDRNYDVKESVQPKSLVFKC